MALNSVLGIPETINFDFFEIQVQKKLGDDKNSCTISKHAKVLNKYNAGPR